MSKKLEIVIRFFNGLAVNAFLFKLQYFLDYISVKISSFPGHSRFLRSTKPE